MEDIVFSDGLIASFYTVFLVCVFIPVFYCAWYAFKKKIDFIAILGGLAVFFVFSYYAAGMLLGLIESVAGGSGAPLRIALRTVIISAVQTGGMWLGLKLISRSRSSVRVPIGFAVGFRLYDLLYLGAFNALLRLSNAVIAKANGAQELIAAVDAEYASSFEQMLRQLSGTEPYVFFMSAVDYLCMFIISTALIRIIWYSIEGGKTEPNVKLLLTAFVFRAAAELPLALYQVGGGRYELCAVGYYIVCALISVYAYMQTKIHDDVEKISAQRLTAKKLRRRL